MRKIRAIALSLALAALPAAVAACNTPTLPIPPPIVEPLTAPDPATGLVEVRIERSIPEKASHAIVINTATQHGVIEARLLDGTFLLHIPAESGDYLQCYLLLGFGEISQGTVPLRVP
ncbi:MAG: hypothetical protein GYA57_16460 [Myxococcales bacterium]|nr:hypothetical protein [Myxococcales bacterium]